MRRAQITFKGTANDLSWTVTPQLVSTPILEDGWVEYAMSGDALHLMAGKFPTLEGWELYLSNAKTLFVERGLSSNLGTGREIGVQATGSLFNGVLSYGAGVVDGALDTNTQNNDANLSGDMNAVGRVMFTPFAPVKDSVLKDLGIGFSGSVGRENTSINGNTDRAITYKTIGRNVFLSIQNGVAIYGQRYRLNPQMSYYIGSFGFMSEYMQSSYNMTRGGVSRDITNAGWTAQASYVLTGEKASMNGVTPAHPFSLKDGTWGAFELGVRYNAFEGDKDLFAGKSSQLLATTTSAQKADAYGVALKWYLTNNLLWDWNYEYTGFSGLGVDKQPEQALVTRIQIDF